MTPPSCRLQAAFFLSILTAAVIFPRYTYAQFPEHPDVGQQTPLVEPIITPNHIAIKAAQELYFNTEQLKGQPATEFATRYSTFTLSDTPTWLKNIANPPARRLGDLPGDTTAYTFGWPWQGHFGYSWWAWWELNQAQYITPKLKPVNHLAATTASIKRDLTRKTAQTLEEATYHQNPLLREAAALALGRIKATQYIARLDQLTDDPHYAVRRAAFYALALMDNPQATQRLTQPRDQLDELDAASLVTAIGLLEKSNPAAIEILTKALRQSESPTTATQAVWAITQLNPPNLRDIALDLINTSPYHSVTHRALLALAQNPNPDDADTLAQYAKHIEDSNLPAIPEAGIDLRQNSYALPFTPEDIRIASHTINLRIAASRALGSIHQHNPDHSYIIQQGIYKAPRSSAILHEITENIFTLADFARPTESAFLIETLNGRIPAPTRPFEQKDEQLLAANARIPGSALGRQDTPSITADPFLIRPQAALALGTILRRTGDVLPPFFARQHVNQSSITGNLIRYANNDDIYPELRNASVLALGIADDPRVIPHLMSAAELGARIDRITTAYALLSLALLGEHAVLNVAANILNPPANRLDVQRLAQLNFEPEPLNFEAILANRTVIQAIGLLQDPESAPILIGQWGQNLWTDIETATALNRCGRYEITNDLITLAQSDNPTIQLSAIWSLGALHEPEPVSRLYRLTNNQSPWLLLSATQFLYARHVPPFKLKTHAERYLTEHPSYHLASPGNWIPYASPLLFNHPLRAVSHPHF